MSFRGIIRFGDAVYLAVLNYGETGEPVFFATRTASSTVTYNLISFASNSTSEWTPVLFTVTHNPDGKIAFASSPSMGITLLAQTDGTYEIAPQPGPIFTMNTKTSWSTDTTYLYAGSANGTGSYEFTYNTRTVSFNGYTDFAIVPKDWFTHCGSGLENAQLAATPSYFQFYNTDSELAWSTPSGLFTCASEAPTTVNYCTGVQIGGGCYSACPDGTSPVWSNNTFNCGLMLPADPTLFRGPIVNKFLLTSLSDFGTSILSRTEDSDYYKWINWDDVNDDHEGYEPAVFDPITTYEQTFTLRDASGGVIQIGSETIFRRVGSGTLSILVFQAVEDLPPLNDNVIAYAGSPYTMSAVQPSGGFVGVYFGNSYDNKIFSVIPIPASYLDNCGKGVFTVKRSNVGIDEPPTTTTAWTPSAHVQVCAANGTLDIPYCTQEIETKAPCYASCADGLFPLFSNGQFTCETHVTPPLNPTVFAGPINYGSSFFILTVNDAGKQGFVASNTSEISPYRVADVTDRNYTPTIFTAIKQTNGAFVLADTSGVGGVSLQGDILDYTNNSVYFTPLTLKSIKPLVAWPERVFAVAGNAYNLISPSSQITRLQWINQTTTTVLWFVPLLYWSGCGNGIASVTQNVPLDTALRWTRDSERGECAASIPSTGVPYCETAGDTSGQCFTTCASGITPYTVYNGTQFVCATKPDNNPDKPIVRDKKIIYWSVGIGGVVLLILLIVLIVFAMRKSK